MLADGGGYPGPGGACSLPDGGRRGEARGELLDDAGEGGPLLRLEQGEQARDPGVDVPVDAAVDRRARGGEPDVDDAAVAAGALAREVAVVMVFSVTETRRARSPIASGPSWPSQRSAWICGEVSAWSAQLAATGSRSEPPRASATIRSRSARASRRIPAPVGEMLRIAELL
jgi:hypothetical protein